ncbi:hypothetical protein P8C59_001579 [Phyllachora maydis]|uniref:RWD domain-containing protein n=1 Tax=Phyllachora maydis TaxID=1825666 RepID=A0AAD9MAE1_9PEZI|nr:hypothetical protein P8C59_001579 [Phyllachora maydis]
MSESLLDEVEAINSIYGDGTLTASPDQPAAAAASSPSGAPPSPPPPAPDPIYILRLPPHSGADSGAHHPQQFPPAAAAAAAAVSLRLQFPATYPDAPPAVLATHSAAGTPRGAAGRALGLFRAAVAAVYQPGQVCLFDALEQCREQQQQQLLLLPLLPAEETPAEPPPPPPLAPQPPSSPPPTTTTTTTAAREPRHGAEERAPDPDRPWTLSAPLTELKSTFVARCARAHTPAQARGAIARLLATDRRVRGATHNVTAWRIRAAGAAVAYQDCDDDGEAAAGARLLHLLQRMGLWDVVVVVTRWYGGLKLGPRRFALINAAARDALVRAGMVPGEGAAAGGEGKGPGRKGNGRGR